MARAAETYRGARRNAHHGNWPETPVTRREQFPAARPNKRDRSDPAEKLREARGTAATIQFAGSFRGLNLALVNHMPPTKYEKKPKRGWAAKARKRPFPKDDPVEMAKHHHPRHKRAAAIAKVRAA